MCSRHATRTRSRRSGIASSLLAALAIAGVALVAGCGDDEPAGPGEVTPPSRATARDLLTSWFERAYTTKDSSLYAEMLDSLFTFGFNTAGCESLAARAIPASNCAWGDSLDLASTWRMFGASNVGTIALDITVDNEGDYTGVDCNACREVLASVSLSVTVDPQVVDPRVLTVDAAQTFVVKKDPADTTLWVLFRQVDPDPPGKRAAAGGSGLDAGAAGASDDARSLSKASGPSSTEVTTWSDIKLRFLP